MNADPYKESPSHERPDSDGRRRRRQQRADRHHARPARPAQPPRPDRRGGQAVKTIAVTGYHSNKVRHDALQAGFNAYQPKPIDPTSFSRVIDDLFGSDYSTTTLRTAISAHCTRTP